MNNLYEIYLNEAKRNKYCEFNAMRITYTHVSNLIFFLHIIDVEFLLENDDC